MDTIIFKVIDKRGRIVRSSSSAWTHIRVEHPNVEQEEVIETLQKADKTIVDEREDVEYFFRYFKHKKQISKFLKVVVRYINNEGSILSAHFVRHIS